MIKSKWFDIFFKLDLIILDIYCIYEIFNYYKWKFILMVWINLIFFLMKKCLCILSFGYYKLVMVWFFKKLDVFMVIMIYI